MEKKNTVDALERSEGWIWDLVVVSYVLEVFQHQFLLGAGVSVELTIFGLVVELLFLNFVTEK